MNKFFKDITSHPSNIIDLNEEDELVINDRETFDIYDDQQLIYGLSEALSDYFQSCFNQTSSYREKFYYSPKQYNNEVYYEVSFWDYKLNAVHIFFFNKFNCYLYKYGTYYYDINLTRKLRELMTEKFGKDYTDALTRYLDNRRKQMKDEIDSEYEQQINI